MKIVHICLNFNSIDDERRVYSLIQRLQKNFDQTLITKRQSHLWELSVNLKNVQTVVVKPFPMFLTAFDVRSVFKTKEFLIIHAHSERDSETAYSLKNVFNYPFIVTVGNDRSCKYKKYIRPWRYASKLIPVSVQAQEAILEAYSISEDKTDYIRKYLRCDRIIKNSDDRVKNYSEIYEEIKNKTSVAPPGQS
jgi:hypothetical protein